MAQIFHRNANTFARILMTAALVLIVTSVWILYGLNRSTYNTRQGVVREQPIPFSHKHHVAGLGVDCRYCHTAVEQSDFAGIPPTKTCMTCHSQIWSDSPMLEPVRESYRADKSIGWTKVHDLPDFVYFNHSIHVNKGVGCATCHGPIDQMPMVYQESTLQMEWCLECHRQPERFVRPREQVFNMDWQPPTDQLSLGKQLVEAYKIQKLTNCSVCHR